MRPLCCVAVLAFFWGMCMTKPFPEDMDTLKESNGKDDTSVSNEAAMQDLCDLIRTFWLAELMKSETPLVAYMVAEGKGAGKKDLVQEFLVRFCFLARDKRQSEPYNLNSFGLRFGKRDTKFNWNSFGLRFGKKRQMPVPIYELDNIICN